MSGLWVFAYGSLIWDPGFPVQRRLNARVEGYRRGFFMRSVHHRGTPDEPGLVLALDRADGSVCQGSLLEVPKGSEEHTLNYLRERELISSAYVETRLVAESDGNRYQAVTFVVDRKHPQYVTGLSVAEQAAIITKAKGGRGTNSDYLWSTYVALQDAGINDPELEEIARYVMADRMGQKQELA